MSCNVADHGKELRDIARTIHDKIAAAEDWRSFYRHLGAVQCSMELVVAVSDCAPHKKIFEVLLKAVFASYVRARLETQPDSLFTTVRNEYLTQFHDGIMEISKDFK